MTEPIQAPALVIDLDAFERNLRRLADRVAGSGVNMGPHAKTHKCPVIALKQMELGAVGVCVAIDVIDEMTQAIVVVFRAIESGEKSVEHLRDDVFAAVKEGRQDLFRRA